MNKFYLIFILIFPTFLFAQNNKSLSIPELDSLMVLSYNKGDYASGIVYAQQWATQANAQGLDSCEAKALNFLGLLYFYAAQYPECEQTHQKALQIRKKILGVNSYDYSESLHNLGLLAKTLGQFKKAENYYQQSIEIEKNLVGEYSEDYAKSLNNLATLYQTMGKVDELENIYLKVLEIRKKTIGTNHPSYAVTLSNLAMYYNRQNRHEEAEAMYLEALGIIKKVENPNYLMSIQNNLAALYHTTKRYDDAEKLYLDLVSIQKDVLGENHPSLAATYNNLAAMYSQTNHPQKAEKLIQQSLNIRIKSLGKKHPLVANSMSSLALLYLQKKDFIEAEKLLLESIAITKETEGINNVSLCKPLLNLAHLYYHTKQVQQSKQAIYESLVVNSTTPIDSHAIQNDIISLVQQHEFKDDETALKCLAFLSEIQPLFLEKSALENLKKRLELTKAQSLLIQQQEQQLVKKSDKLQVLTNSSQFLLESITINHQLFEATKDIQYLENALIDAEFNKSVALSSALQSDNALIFGEVPDSLAMEERFIQESLSSLRTKLIQATQQKDSSKMVDMQRQLVEFNFKQDALKKHLERNFPKYSQLKYHQERPSLSLIQQQLLTEETALLEYFVSDTISYLILVTSSDIQLFPLSIQSTELTILIEKLRRSLSDYNYIIKEKEKAFVSYSDAAFNLYQKLIAPANALLKNKKRLIIVPDNQLGHIPFEALLTKPSNQTEIVNYKDLPYLIQQYQISYSYSISLLLENKKHQQQQHPYNLLAFASTYDTLRPIATRTKEQAKIRAGLDALPEAIREVKALESLFQQSTFYYNQAANEANFKKEAANYAILHLAMHGILHPHTPLLSALVFTENNDTIEDNFLAAHEISHLQLNNELVVLSACETGYGKFEQGEGVVSLARSFMYAGVPSMIVSLWQVNDGSTSIIMQFFYKNLVAGQHKDAALRNAKLSYLEQANEITSHPAFWSPFIQLGEASPIMFTTSSRSWKWWFLGGFLIIIIGAVLKRRSSSLTP